MKRWVSTLFLMCIVLISAPPSFARAQNAPTTPGTTSRNIIGDIQNVVEGLNPAARAVGIATRFATGTPASSSCGTICEYIRSFFIMLVTIPVFAAGTLMYITGIAFDWTVKYFAAQLGFWLTSQHIMEPLTQVWGTFRDIAHILLIFSFVFVALRTILGVGHNNKQMVVRVIIVALLINFSLFFVKVSLDVTNFFAYQFYKSMSLEDASPNAIQTERSVSARFAAAMGVSGFANIRSTAQQQLEATAKQGGFFIAMTHGIGLTTLYLAAAYVFGFATILLFIRTVTLIFLMIISSAAFACYLTPKTKEYFDQWFDALWKNAIFAPTLLILLWAAMLLTDALIGVGGRQGLTGAIFQGGGKDALKELINFVLVIGFLFGSISIARRVAGQSSGLLSMIAGALPTGRMLGGLVAGAPFRLAGRGREAQVKRATTAHDNAFANLQNMRATGTKAQIASAEKALEAAKKRMQNTGDFRADSNLAKMLQKAGVNMGTPTKEAISKTVEDKKKLAEKEMKDTVRALEEAAKNAGTSPAQQADFEKRRVEAAKAAENLKQQYSSLEQAAASSKVSGDAGGRTGAGIEAAINDLGSKIQKETNAQATLKTQLESAKTSGNNTLAAKIQETINTQTAKIQSFQAEQNAELALLKGHRDEVARADSARLDKIVEASTRSADATAELTTAEQDKKVRAQRARESLKANGGRQVFENMIARGFTPQQASAAAQYASKDEKTRAREEDRSRRNKFYDREPVQPTPPSNPTP